MRIRHSIHCRGYRGCNKDWDDDACDCGATISALRQELERQKSLLVSFGEMDMEMDRNDTLGVVEAYEEAFEAVRVLAVELAEQAGLGGKRGEKQVRPGHVRPAARLAGDSRG